jgi:hypothetical protein
MKGIPSFAATVLNNIIDGFVPFFSRLVNIFVSFYRSNNIDFKIISEIINA